MIRIESIRLVPVIELEPSTYATASRDSPCHTAAEAPEQWTQYWLACLADSGLTGLRPISPGSWFVRAATIAPAELAIILDKELSESGIPGFPDSDGEVDPELDERISALPGGLAVYDGEMPLIEPSCCGDLGNLDDWRDAARERDAEWQDLWIGHPQLRFRVANGDAEIHETQEYDLPKNPRHFAVSVQKLSDAIADARGEQERFQQVVKESLTAIAALRAYSQEQIDQLARLLVGRRNGGDERELSEDDVEALAALGYHRIWLDSGVLSPSQLRNQFEAFKEPGGDGNREHYRYNALSEYIDNLDHLSDEEVQHLLLIALYDEDDSIKAGVPHSLLRANVLSEAQFERVAESFESDSFDRLVSRMRLLRGLDRDVVPPEYIQKCIDEGDRDAHEALLGLPSLERDHVAQLAENGANKRVRSMAGQLLDSRRFRNEPG